MSEKERADSLELVALFLARKVAMFAVLNKPLLILCREIEKLPASEQQTKVSKMANAIHTLLALAQTTSRETYEQSWECPNCLVFNYQYRSHCIFCDTQKPPNALP